MRIGTLGHAGLYLETEDQRVLVDPVFAETLLDGILEYHPQRRLHLERMPAPSALILTHAHFDHFHAASLETLPRELPVVVPDDPVLLEGLGRMGFGDLRICAPWASVQLGQTRILATPSGHDEPEMGVVVSDPRGTFWHMADAEVSPADGARVLREHGAVDVVSAKYQPVVRASMGYLRSRGARFDAQEVVDWLETACAVDPAFVFPYASGLAFSGRHAWFNRYAFPLSADEVTALLWERLGPERAATLLPGDAVEVRARGERPVRVAGALGFCETVPTRPVVWEPVEVATLAGLDDPAERARLEDRLDQCLTGSMASWFTAELAHPSSIPSALHAHGGVWQLSVEAGGGERIERHIDFGAVPYRVERGRHPRARSFTHLSGRGLLDALDGTIPGIVFWLAGDARSYEKNIVVQGGRLLAPAVPVPEDELGDPLTHYLRYYGPRGERVGSEAVRTLAPSEPERDDSTGLDVIARAGESRAVIEKKALLALLAEEDATRRGLAVSAEAVQATSDGFRARFGFHSDEDTRRWMERAGLTGESYAAVMRRFAAVQLIQAARASDIDAIIEDHARVASAASGPR
ncbi:MAG: MBL fold metallo-hydrolase [Polyangiaceae bacterium]|nr:MBL fold metallo-hydrolase [Polyangiaceae bacterium]